MLSHSMIILFMCLVNLGSIYYCLFIPWARPIVPVSHGLYEISMPMEIGLFECFSSICRKYNELEHFLLRHPTHLFKEQPPNQDASTSTTLTSNDSLQSPHGFHLPTFPKRIHLPSSVLNPIQHEKQSVERFLLPYKTASIISLVWLSLSGVISLALLCLLGYEYCSSLFLLTNNMKNILLLANTFTLFVAIICYLLFTYAYMNGGIYVDGVWIGSYASVVGLLCCLLVNILETSYEMERIHQSVEIYVQSHSPERVVMRNQEDGAEEEETRSLIEQKDVEGAADKQRLYYQYELVSPHLIASNGDSNPTNKIPQTPPRRK